MDPAPTRRTLAAPASLPRRRLLQMAAAGVAASLAPDGAMAGPFAADDFVNPIPEDKKLRPEWVRSLFARGEPTVYRGSDREKIGMPVGGIGCGMLYLGGDGRLWLWDLFNRVYNPGTDGPHYARPLAPTAPLSQGFALRVQSEGKAQERTMDADGWRDVAFSGTYPIGTVEYADPDCPVRATLEAFSPFIPLNTDDSSLPATVLRFTLTNTGKTEARIELAGWLENAVCLHTAVRSEVLRRNRTLSGSGFSYLDCRAEAPPSPRRRARPDIPFDDFERADWGAWTATGTAFGEGPVEIASLPAYMGPVDGHGKRVVNTHHFRLGDDVVGADRHVGTLTSPEFPIERDYITFLIGGGNHAGRTCVNLLVDGKEVASLTGSSTNVMAPVSFDVRRFAGRKARLQAVDNESGGWGQIALDDIVFSDRPREALGLTERHDFGSMGLALLGSAPGDRAVPALPSSTVPAGVFSGGRLPPPGPAVAPPGRTLIGALSRPAVLAPGRSITISFVLTWHFPHIALTGLKGEGGRHYAGRFADARAVAAYVATHFPRLNRETRLWRDTWYDSTLPHWFLDRTFASASTLATTTCYRFRSGRFYGWEGVGCCEGTCTHVWHYAHAVARLFPDLERDLRERTDFSLAFDPRTGLIQHRGTHGAGLAVDGQAGILLRTLREHQMSASDAFLRRVWPRAKRALEHLIGLDADADGLLDGPQHNTYDAAWFGKIAWISGLYLAALRAGETMAREMGDTAFAQDCRRRFETGRAAIEGTLFNGEYFVHLPDPDPAHRAAVGSFDACFADQVFGQSWANQVGLGRVLEEAKVKSALKALWKYNFTPDVAAWRASRPAGRWYAMPGEGGLVLANWPTKPSPVFRDHPSAWSAMYFNETWTGFEYQVAGHLLAEGMQREGLAIVRAVHDRYHPSRRNPYNEIECSDHYARAMAGYGVFVAACGFTLHGPGGEIGFAPKLTPENFKAAFTAPEGWGSFQQRREPSRLRCALTLRWGRLSLKTLTLAAPEAASRVTASVGGRAVPARVAVDGDRVRVHLVEGVTLRAGETLSVLVE